MSFARIHPVAVLMLMICMGGAARPVSVEVQEIDPVRYAQVKAAFVLNFVRYSEWPEEAFADEESPVSIVVLGEDRMTYYLRRLIVDKQINERPITVRRIDYPEPPPWQRELDEEVRDMFHRDLRSAHLLYIGATEYDRLDEVLEIIKDHSVLTVSDISRFADRGGMLGMAVREGRVRIDANISSIRRSDVSVSSHVLRLARIVEDEEQDADSNDAEMNAVEEDDRDGATR